MKTIFLSKESTNTEKADATIESFLEPAKKLIQKWKVHRPHHNGERNFSIIKRLIIHPICHFESCLIAERRSSKEWQNL